MQKIISKFNILVAIIISIIITGGFLAPSFSQEEIPSPKTQVAQGITPEAVTCKEDLSLIIKNNGSPACVKNKTLPILEQRGWGFVPAPCCKPTTVSSFESFEECVAAGNPILESFPRKCRASDGREYVESIVEQQPNDTSVMPSEIDFNNSVKANNQFAIDYYRKINSDENVFFSPWSISSAFAIVNEGAKGNTSEEIQKVFGFDKNSKEQFKEINRILNQKNQGYTIKVANSLWLAEDFTLNSNFEDIVQSYYDGKVKKVDFASDGTEIINEWVANKTHQKIPELFNPPLDPFTRLVVANAIYFNGTWNMPFEEKNTRNDKFILSPEMDVTVPFMNKDSFYNHTAKENFQMIELPYEGNKASMLILLPDRIDGIESLEEQLTAENLIDWKSNMKKSRLFLQMPKFTLETEYDLVRDLMGLGIKDAFGPADFSGISSESLFIDRAIHKAFVNVNEKGTEAAAATGIAMLESMPPTFRADHPFVFIIQENETGNILFLGKVGNPAR